MPDVSHNTIRIGCGSWKGIYWSAGPFRWNVSDNNIDVSVDEGMQQVGMLLGL
jgi:hypothetical protein